MDKLDIRAKLLQAQQAHHSGTAPVEDNPFQSRETATTQSQTAVIEREELHGLKGLQDLFPQGEVTAPIVESIDIGGMYDEEIGEVNIPILQTEPKQEVQLDNLTAPSSNIQAALREKLKAQSLPETQSTTNTSFSDIAQPSENTISIDETPSMSVPPPQPNFDMLAKLRGAVMMSEDEVDEDDEIDIKPSASLELDLDDLSTSASWQSIQGTNEKLVEQEEEEDYNDWTKGIDINAPQNIAGGLPMPVFDDISPEDYDLTSLPEEFEDLANDILQYKPDLKIEEFNAPLEFGLEAFLRMNPTYTVLDIQTRYKIDNLIQVEHDDPYISLIMGIMNLQENQTSLTFKLSRDIKTFEATVQDEIAKYRREGDHILSKYNEMMEQQKSTLGTTVNNLHKNINYLNTQMSNSLNSLSEQILLEVEEQYKPHIKSARDLKKQIDKKKSELEQILKSVNQSDLEHYESVQISLDDRSLDDIKDLIEEVKQHLEDVDFKDIPYFKRYIKRFFDYFFILTDKAENNVRALFFLLNILGFILFLKFLSPLFITFVLTTIALDAFQFFKLVDTNKSTVFLVNYSKNVEGKINQLKENSLAEINEELEPYTDFILEMLDDKVKAIKDYADKVNDYNVSQLKRFITYEEVYESVYGKIGSIEKAIKEISAEKIEALRTMNEDIVSSIPEQIDEAVEKLNKAPNENIMDKQFNRSFVWKKNYKIGRYGVSIDQTIQAGIDARVNLDEGSYVVVVKGEEEKEEAINKFFNLAIQQYNNIMPEYFTVNYIDTTNLGSDLIPMMSANPVVARTIIENKAKDEHLTKVREEMGKRYSEKLRSYRNCTHYNDENKDNPDADKLPYIATVLYGYDENTLKSSGLRTIAKSSYMTGMPLFLFFDLEEFQTFDKEGNPELDKNIIKTLQSFDYRVEKVEGEWEIFQGNRKENPEGVIFKEQMRMQRFPLEFEELDYMDKIKQLEGYISDSKMETILFKDLLQLYAPELHKGNTVDGIEICMGYKDGDFTKPYTSVLGNDSVHALMGGSTGSGKSNTINVFLACMTAKYPPEWLELYMIDFKVVEFKFFTRVINYPKFSRAVCRLPHTSMIAGTTDPEYSLSVFTRALKEMTRRLKMMANGINHNGETITFKQVSVWNKFVLDNNLREKGVPIIPRIMILVDEFQAMFKMEDKEALSFIKLVITRLGKEARAAGIHMFFTSQSMEGTMDDDVKAQFKMRYCLAAPAPISKSVIGNAAASTLTGKGFIYLNESSERKEEDNVKIKVPFIPEDDLRELMTRIEGSAKNLVQMADYKLPYHAQEFYDEEKSHDERELEAYLEMPEIHDNKNAVIIGNKVVFKTNPLPENFVLGNSDYENILVTSNSRINAANIINTLMMNFKSKHKDNMILAMNYDATLDGLLKEEYADAEFAEFFKEEKQDLLYILDTLIEDLMNVELGAYPKWEDLKPNLENYNPQTSAKVYIFITGLNKAPGFNTDMHDPKHQERLLWLLKWGPLFGVHLIFYWKEPFKQDKYLTYTAYRITAKISADQSFALFRDRKARDLLTSDGVNFGLFKSQIDDRMFKFKIYEFKYDKSLLTTSELNFSVNFGEGQVG